MQQQESDSSRSKFTRQHIDYKYWTKKLVDRVKRCVRQHPLTARLLLLPPESWEVPFEEISDLQWVGSGAQGAVFLGKFHGEEVAVKKVRDIKETEIKHLRKLKHPNIITFK